MAMNVIHEYHYVIQMIYFSLPDFSIYQSPSGPKVVTILRFYCIIIDHM